MDKLNHYRTLIKQIISHHAEQPPSVGQIETIPVFDDQNNQYFLVDFGWNRMGRVHLAFYRPERRAITEFAVA